MFALPVATEARSRGHVYPLALDPIGPIVSGAGALLAEVLDEPLSKSGSEGVQAVKGVREQEIRRSGRSA
jgi:hypothetical protein